VTIDGALDLAPLAVIGRRLKGKTQEINRGADIFLADEKGRYIDRICRFRECFPRQMCIALNCGAREHLNDDLADVTLPQSLIQEPPVELWPRIVRRVQVPVDVESLLLAELECDETPETVGPRTGF